MAEFICIFLSLTISYLTISAFKKDFPNYVSLAIHDFFKFLSYPLILLVWCIICTYVHRISLAIYTLVEPAIFQLSNIDFGVLIAAFFTWFLLIFGEAFNRLIINSPKFEQQISSSHTISGLIILLFLPPFSFLLSTLSYIFLYHIPVTPEDYRIFMFVSISNYIFFLILADLGQFIASLHFHLIKYRLIPNIRFS